MRQFVKITFIISCTSILLSCYVTYGAWKMSILYAYMIIVSVELNCTVYYYYLLYVFTSSSVNKIKNKQFGMYAILQLYLNLQCPRTPAEINIKLLSTLLSVYILLVDDFISNDIKVKSIKIWPFVQGIPLLSNFQPLQLKACNLEKSSLILHINFFIFIILCF